MSPRGLPLEGQAQLGKTLSLPSPKFALLPGIMTIMAGADRFILHLDMDAFYAAIEQRDHPELRGKPVLVGGSPQGRGVVSTASYEARPFGCRSAMPMVQAMRLCSQAVVIPPRIDRYSDVSRQVFEVLEQFTPLVEPLSIDEAFLDVTGSIQLFGPAEQIARDLRKRILQDTGLTGSVGVAPNKFVAKLASDHKKPDGLVVVQAGEVQAFLDPLPISRLWGVGRATLPKFEELGIRTFGDARRSSEVQLLDRFGEAGRLFSQLVRGIDDRPVVPDREAQSLSHETTFPEDVQDRANLRSVLLEQTEQVARRLRRHGLQARTVVLKIRLPDFATLTRRTTLDTPTKQTEELWGAAAMLFEEWARVSDSRVRLLGIGATNLSRQAGQQLSLFGTPEQERRGRLNQAVDSIVDRFGTDAIGRGLSAHSSPEPPRENPPAESGIGSRNT